jgi:hypothetical protein
LFCHEVHLRRDKRSLALLAALYIAQILLSGWLHADLDVGVCKQCREQTGPSISAACDGNGPCSLPSHHHHPRQHRDHHIGCSMCSPLASLPVEKPCFLTPAQATFRARREIVSSQLEPRVLGQQCPRGPPSIPSEI